MMKKGIGIVSKKRLVLVIALILLMLLMTLSGCGDSKKNQTLINFYGEDKYNELSVICSDNEKLQVANDLVGIAKNVLSDTKQEYTVEMVGALERYSYKNPAITNVNVQIELITTEQTENTGYVWVRYSALYYENKDLVLGARDVISRWTIERKNNEWIVILVEEP